MANEPRRTRHALKAFALALISSLALTAAGASTAGATSLDFAEGIPEEASFSVTDSYGAELELDEAAGGCNGEITGGATYQGESASYLWLEFSGCNAALTSGCGTMVTSLLAMDFTSLPAAEGGDPAVVLTPVGTDVFAECSESGNALKGSMIGVITEAPGEGEKGGSLELEFQGSEGEQDHTETFRGRSTDLTYTWYGYPHDASFSFSIGLDSNSEFSLTSEEDGHPDLEPQVEPGDFASTPFGMGLYSSEMEIKCKDFDEEANPLGSGGGAFDSAQGGEVNFTFRGCKIFGLFYCTSPGQEKGTINTDDLPVELVYLSDGKPGIAIEESETSGKILEATCFGVKSVLSGGALAPIVYPADGFGLATGSFWTSLVSEEGEQEYTETEGGEEYDLQLSRGGTNEPATMGLLAINSMDEGSFQLRE